MAIIAQASVQTCPAPWTGTIKSGQHEILTDKPESFGGQDKGLAPYDLLCASLISCTMITLRMYAQHKGIDFGDFSVDAEFCANKAGEEWIERRLSFNQRLDASMRDKVLAICEKTPVTKTLLRSVKISTMLNESDKA